ncbi:hypothetical protein CYMTET_19680 [Cymbomonas tetramitiformis]|uniref:F-box domain-containing protein n=1 Tax=Cymbomonas tetramitiformis TaxID=36881 RepID=A0AAE0G5J0_9CHLO|nr:hypothetical protein CYMTET_19680 [Cymbomonas tetramitiformis]
MAGTPTLTFKFPSWEVRILPESVVEKEEKWQECPDQDGEGNSAAWDADLDSLDGSDGGGEEPDDQLEEAASQNSTGEALVTSDIAESSGARRKTLGLATSAEDSSGRPKKFSLATQAPSEVLLLVASCLSFRDLASAMFACKHWYSICGGDEAWHLLWLRMPNIDCLLPQGAPSTRAVEVPVRGLSWRAFVKRTALATGISLRFMVLRKGYEFIRESLHARWEDIVKQQQHSTWRRVTHVDELWEHPQQVRVTESEERFPTRKIASLTTKLTHSDWSLMYEGMIEIFADRADRIACALRDSLSKTLDDAPGAGAPVDSSQHSLHTPSSGMSASGGELRLHGEERGEDAAQLARGLALWREVILQWQLYRQWLGLAAGFTRKLATQVEAERTRTGVPRTPLLIEAGAICFRSQVLLTYELREPLQTALEWLVAKLQLSEECAWQPYAGGSTLSDKESDLLERAQQLLQELDVADDAAQPGIQATREKLHRCCGVALKGLRSRQKKNWARCA